ncbi:LexA family protein [Methylomonas sp. YC3]|jgi:SOS-response transcriptional repressors (RecA-mediated autopeptidases)
MIASSSNLPQQLSDIFSQRLKTDNLELPILEPSQVASILELPLFTARVPAGFGFPSPADDHLEAAIDLNEQYVQHPASTFYVRVKGHSMKDAGIHSGDMLIVDRSLEAKSDSIVIAVVNGELTVKRLVLENQQVWLKPENADYKPLLITEEMDLHIWGVVAHVIHSL